MSAITSQGILGVLSEDCDQRMKNIDSQFILNLDTPVVELDAAAAFANLTLKEKLYAHYLSKASWYGSLICLVQSSPESPLIFLFVLKVFGEQPVDELERRAFDHGISQEEFQAILVYSAGVLANLGNYKSFGDTKFVPAASPEVFEKLMRMSQAYELEPEKMDSMWEQLKSIIYSLSDREKTLGFPDKGITTYMSSNCSKVDTDLVNRYLRHIGMEAYNTRVFKTLQNNMAHYEIRIASIDTGDYPNLTRTGDAFEGAWFSVTRGDYSPLMAISAEYLKEAKWCQVTQEMTGAEMAGRYQKARREELDTGGEGQDMIDYQGRLHYRDRTIQKWLNKAENYDDQLVMEYVENENERLMIEKYIESFQTGSLEAHKDGSRYWIKNKGPVVETYIGFIETYRDPAGERADFTGWVAVVNKERSENFGKLVDSAETILPLLPWGKAFEKDAFLKPDFTSLDVLTFANNSVPAGINIPNYDSIRQNEGYKNVSLGNVISSSAKDDKISFLLPADQKIVRQYRTKAFEVQVGLHELLGHGSGKFFKMEASGKLNFDVDEVINPLTGGKIDKWYGTNETYDSKFTVISSSYEECRAEAVGLFLSLDPNILKIFGYEGEEAETLVYANWLSMMWNVVANGPDSYSVEKKCWLQAHAQARYVLLRVLMEAGDDLINFVETEPEKDLLLTLDRKKIHTVGKKAVGDFLLKLQVYRSLGDVESAEEMYNKYSEVPEDGVWKNWRKIAFLHMKPRRMFLQSNTNLIDGEVELKRYEPSFSGIIQSWMERFESFEVVRRILEDLWLKDQPFFY